MYSSWFFYIFFCVPTMYTRLSILKQHSCIQQDWASLNNIHVYNMIVHPKQHMYFHRCVCVGNVPTRFNLHGCAFHLQCASQLFNHLSPPIRYVYSIVVHLNLNFTNGSQQYVVLYMVYIVTVVFFSLSLIFCKLFNFFQLQQWKEWLRSCTHIWQVELY